MSSKEVKRIRGEIACAECRRLKIRCDRNIPCATCVKRGCGALCPTGTIPPGDGSRFVLAATDHLTLKISTMEARMHALEDAIFILQGTNSGLEHSLLLSSSVKAEEEHSSTHLHLKPLPESTKEEQVNPKGTLHMDSEAGRSLYFGPGGGSESLLLKAQGTESSPIIEELDTSYLPPEIDTAFSNFLLRPHQALPRTTMQTTIESFLPPLERATHLVDTFLEHLSWMFHIVSRRELVVDLMPVVYKYRHGSYGPHDLALLLITLGIGALVDEELPPYNLEAQHYYKLTQAALSLQTVLVEESVKTIKVLHLMSIYNGMSGKENNIEMCYGLLSLAGQTAMRIGFHVDPSMWGFSGKEAYDRRCYFYNLLAGILWQCLTTGRPPSICTDAIDVHVPSAEDEDQFQLGEVPLGFGRWGFMANRDLLIPVVKAVLAAKPPDYSHILELDRGITTFVPTIDGNPEDTRTSITMRVFVRSHYQALIKMYLHRGHFAEVLMEMPFNPFRSPYKQSFVSAYQSACFVLQDTIEQFAKKPVLCSRVWQIWSFAFSAAMVIGAVAVRAPQMPGLEPQPFSKFEEACNLFQTAAETSARAARGLPVLLAMREKAFYALRNLRQRHSTSSNPTYDPKEELSLFSGLTPLVASKGSSKGASPPSISSTSTITYESGPWIPTSLPPYSDSQPPVVDGPSDISEFWPFEFSLDVQPNLSTGQGHHARLMDSNQGTAYPADGYGMPVLDQSWLSAMHGYGLASYFQR